jgi:DNA invertase Pin-like site-specific DNA recombinase
MDTAAANQPRRREGAHVGYASYSKREGRAALDAQFAELERLGCQVIKIDEVGSTGERKALTRLLPRLLGGEVLIVTKLDRLARSAQEAAEIAQAVHSSGAALRILNLDLDTGTVTGKQVLQVLIAAAEAERTTRLNEQYEAKQRMIGFVSRDLNIRVLALENLARVDALVREGLTWPQMARRLGLSETIVRHSCYELKRREEGGDPKLERELSHLRERLAVLMSEGNPSSSDNVEAGAPTATLR